MDSGAAFTGGAGDDTFNADVSTMQALDVVNGGAGTDTLSIRDSVSIASRPGSHTGFEVLNVESTSGSVGQVAAAATIAARQQFTIDFTAAVFGGAATTTLTVTVGGVARTVAIGATPVIAATNVGAAIESILDDAFGTSTYVVDDGAGLLTITAATAGTPLPAVTIAAGTATITTAPVQTSVQANQVAADAVAASTFSVMTGVTEASITAATTANVSSVSTAATTVDAGGVVVLSGGLSQTVATAGSVQVSGGTGAVAVTTGVPTGTLAAVANTGWTTAAAGVFVRGGTTVSVTETAGTSSSGAVPGGNATRTLIGADPTAASGTAGANAGAIVSSLATGAEVIGNLSSAPTGNVSTVERTLYTGNNATNPLTNGLTNVHYGTGVVDVFMNGGDTASITGAGVVNITDVRTVLTKASTLADALPGTSRLATVNLTGVTGAASVKSDAIATISAIDTTNTVTVTSNLGANTGNIALNLANSTVTLVHANATSVSVGSAAGSGRQAIGNAAISSTQASTVTLTTENATSLSFSGANTVSLAASTLTDLVTITSTATGTVNLGTVTSYAALTSVNMSGGTGAVTATVGATITGTPATDRAFVYTGSAGADTVVISAEQRSGTSAAGAAIGNTISLGGGNDVAARAATGAIGAGATLDGGAGTDTVAASLLNVGNATRITNFELLGLDAAGAYDTNLLAGATGFVLLAQGGTYSNAEKAQSLSVGANIGAAATTISFTAADVAGSADGYAINFAAVGSASVLVPTSIDAGTLVVAGIENVTINSGAASGFVNNVIELTAINLKTVTVTGAAAATNLSFTGVNGTNGAAGGGVTAIDASEFSGALTLNTANLVVDTAAGFAGLAVTSGAGADTLTLTQAAIVNAGAGNDTITLSANGGVVTTGAGRDVVKVGASLGAVTRVTDLQALDTIDFVNGINGAHTPTADGIAELTLSTETTLAEAISSALALDPAATGADLVWFQFGGDTYLVRDGSGGTTATLDATADIVIQLDGLLDFTNSTYDTTNGSLVFG